MLRIRYNNLGISEDESRSFSYGCKVFDCLHSWVWGYSSSQFNIDGSRYAFSRHFCDPKYLDNMCYKSYLLLRDDGFVSYAIYKMNESHQYYLA
jgi:hypothetical protein